MLDPREDMDYETRVEELLLDIHTSPRFKIHNVGLEYTNTLLMYAHLDGLVVCNQRDCKVFDLTLKGKKRLNLTDEELLS